MESLAPLREINEVHAETLGFHHITCLDPDIEDWDPKGLNGSRRRKKT